MINTPLVSIVIPTYNQKESFLRECLDSAISQTYNNIEIVISDNHSTNNVADVLKQYQNIDSRIRIVKPEYFLTMSESLLYVFTQAKGKYSCYISSDDKLYPNCISELVYKMEENENISFSHGMARYFEPNKPDSNNWKYFNEETGVYSINKEIINRLLSLSYVCFGGCLIRNCVWKEVEQTIREKKIDLNNYLDLICTIVLFIKGDLYYLNKVLASVRIENNNRNIKQSVLVKDALLIINFFNDEKYLINKIKEFDIDILKFKENHYKLFLRATLFEFLNELISYNDLIITKNNLRLYNIRKIYTINFFFIICIRFPKLSVLTFQTYKKLKNISF